MPLPLKVCARWLAPGMLLGLALGLTGPGAGVGCGPGGIGGGPATISDPPPLPPDAPKFEEGYGPRKAKGKTSKSRKNF